MELYKIKELVNHTGKTRQYLTRVIEGRSVPNVILAFKIGEYFNINTKFLFDKSINGGKTPKEVLKDRVFSRSEAEEVGV